MEGEVGGKRMVMKESVKLMDGEGKEVKREYKDLKKLVGR